MDLSKLKANFSNFLKEAGKQDAKTQANGDYENTSIFDNSSELRDYAKDENILDFSIDKNELENLQVDNNGYISFNSNSGNTDLDTMADLLNEFFANENNKEAADILRDGQLTAFEIRSLLQGDNIAFDGDASDISFEDLTHLSEALNQTAQNYEKPKTNNTKQGNPLNDVLKNLRQVRDSVGSSSDFPADNSYNSSTNTNTGLSNVFGNLFNSKQSIDSMSYNPMNDSYNNFNNYSTGYTQPSNMFETTGNYDNTTVFEPDSQVKEKDLDQMSRTELEDLQETTEADYKKQNDDLKEILSGNNSELKAQKENVDKLYEKYKTELEKLDKEEAEKLDKFKTDIDAKEKEIDDKKSEIVDQEETERSTKSEYRQARVQRVALEDTLNNLKSSNSANLSDEDKEKLNALIQEVQSQLDAAVKAEEDALNKWEEAKEKLSQLKEEKKTLEDELSKLNEEKDAFETEIAQKYPYIQQYMDEYNQEKADYEENKQNAIDDAQKSVDETAKYLTDIEKQINRAQASDKLQAVYNKTMFSFDEEDDDLYTNLASYTSDYNKSRANEILKAAMENVNGNTKSKGLCAMGVREALEDAYGHSFKHGDAYQWASYLNSMPNDFKNVTSDYSASDLKNLPAGAIVVWSQYNAPGTKGDYGHICIADGKGGEYSDFYNSNIIDFTKRGGTYQIFLPLT